MQDWHPQPGLHPRHSFEMQSHRTVRGQRDIRAVTNDVQAQGQSGGELDLKRKKTSEIACNKKEKGIRFLKNTKVCTS